MFIFVQLGAIEANMSNDPVQYRSFIGTVILKRFYEREVLVQIPS